MKLRFPILHKIGFVLIYQWVDDIFYRKKIEYLQITGNDKKR